MLRILNSQTRQKQDFAPLDAARRRVTMYTCGPTVYDSLHLGHARAAIVPDLVRRYLEYQGYQVRHVTNFTDVDDKIIKRAIREQRDWREITTTYIEEYHRVMMSLNVMPADVYPRATDHIPEMLEIVRRLVEHGHAYVATDGDVYFDTSSFAEYGALSGRNLEEEEAGLSGRIAQDRLAVKRHPGDFVLWKLNKNDGQELRDGAAYVPKWPSPWGDGRPGWHLECSAMSHKYLGVPFDIHCGGQDLLFPHHEDEKAQTECAYHAELHGQQSVRYWVHNAFITIDQEKMSKSLGNVRWLRELIWPEGEQDPMTIRMFMLSSHYRSPLSFEPGMFNESAARLERIYNVLDALARALPGETPRTASRAPAAFETAMDDDFNTAGALAVIFEHCSTANSLLAKSAAGPADTSTQEQLRTLRSELLTMLRVLGLRAERPKTGGGAGDSEKLVDLLLQVRQGARAAKQYALGDQVRNGLKDLGYEVEDLPGGKWAVKKK